MLLTDKSISYRNAVLVFMVMLLFSGISSYMTIPREGTPDITIPYVFISAPYEGVAPEEIENLVVIPMERQLRDLENVKEMTATAAEGVGTIIIEFTPAEDINNALQRTRDKLSLARRDLPGDLDEPVVEAFNFSTDFPILIFTISGSRDLQRLKRLAEDLQDLIEDMPGVKQAAIGGVREREIRVEIDMFRLAGQRLTLGRLLNRIAEENRTVSAGNLEMRGNNLQVRVPGEYDMAADLRDILLEVRDGVPIYLRDVAQVHDTFKDLESISRINGEPGVSLHVKKRSGENTVSLIQRIRDALDSHTLPDDIKLTIIRD
ncbi:MAG: efflux RND transporter permease subunit, partial [Lentisphaerae bacterium]|nr:efflux RND transporter permease subunit [Lentisphaerota bacterium]